MKPRSPSRPGGNPSLADQKRREVENECALLGIQIYRDGSLFRLVGRGINIQVADLSYVALEELSTQRRYPVFY